MSRVAVVIPAKDEGATIGALLDGISRVSVPGHDLHPIVVDDGSTDDTAAIAVGRGASVVSHPENRGLGAAVRTGLRAAVDSGAVAVAYLDADLEYSPEDIPKLLEPVLSGRAGYVLGSRFRGGVRGMRLYRRVGGQPMTPPLVVLHGPRINGRAPGSSALSPGAAKPAEGVTTHVVED